MRATLTALLFGVLLALTSAQSCAGPGDVDLCFDPGSGMNGVVNAISVLSDGRVLIGGNFTTVFGAMRGGLARLNPDGSTDLTFMDGEQGAGSWTYVDAVAVQPDGKIVLAGGFTSFNGAARRGIARLNPDGSLDTTFNATIAGGSYPEARCLSLQSDGRILVGGWFGTVDGVARTNLVRLNADGTLDETFTANVGTSGGYGVFALRLASGGKILTAGNFTTVNGLPQTNLARLNQDGSLDGSFVVSVGVAGETVRSLAVQSDDHVLVGGSFGMVDGIPLETIARLNSDGSLDQAFIARIPGQDNGVQAIEVQSDGRIVIAGDFQIVDGAQRYYLARLNPDGTRDGTFLTGLDGPDGRAWALALQTDGKILVGGQFGSVNGAQCLALARLQTVGALDDTFSNGAGGPNEYVEAVAVQDDGKVVVGGLFWSFNGLPRHGIARLNTDGSLDSSFGDFGSGGSWVFSLAIQPDGKILAGGGNLLARLNPDGSLDRSFDAPLNTGEPYPYVKALAIQPDGKILVGGTFSSVGGGNNKFLARLSPDGSVDPTFLHGVAGVDNSVYLLALQSDGKILIRGFFAFVDGVLRNGFARLNADGSLDASFAYPPDGYAPENFALQNDGKILIGVNLGSGYGIVRLNTDGTSDPSFLNGAVSVNNPCGMSIAIQGDGKILMAGCFTTLNGMPYGRVARLNSDGSLDRSFTEGRSEADSDILALALQGDSAVILGGMFSSVNQVPRRYVARLFTASEPYIIGQPQNVSTNVGATVSFTVSAGGTAPLSYQWWKGTTNLTGATNMTLTIANVQPADAGDYTVVVTNLAGAITSQVATLTVFALPPSGLTYTTNNDAISITGYTGPGGALTIPSTINGLPVTSIGRIPCASLTSVMIPNSVTNIGDWAFQGCSNLTSITIPDSVTSIGFEAFCDCNSLTNATIGYSVTNIGDLAFADCTSLTAITVAALNSAYSSVEGVLFDKSQNRLIECPGTKGGSYVVPNSVTNIGDWAFQGCSNLTSITIPDSVTGIEGAAFRDCTGLTNVAIGNGVTNIGVYAFEDCASLTSVTIGNSVTYVGVGAFWDCTSLINVAIPNSVTSIGFDAFGFCAKLTSVTIGNSVTNIGVWAFEDCTNLTGVYFRGNAPLTSGILFPSFPSPTWYYIATVYYLAGTTGWGATYGGRPTSVWQPQVQTSDPSFGVRTNGFGFTINWASGTSVVVEASTSLANLTWTPLATNTLTSGSSYFSDPQWTNYQSRFYRLRWP